MTKLLSLISILLLSCSPKIAFNATSLTSTSFHQVENKIPTKSFVMIRKVLSIKECQKENSGLCQTGQFRALGSGISIGRFQNGTIFLTAGHVCDPGLTQEQLNDIKEYDISMMVVDTQGRESGAKIVHKVLGGPDQVDMCMMVAENFIVDGVTVASKGPEIGERVFSISAPAGIFHPPTVPILDGIYSGPIPGTGNAMVTIPAIGGSSGSGIFNKDMKLVGILFATHPYFNIITLTSEHRAMLLFMNDGFRILLN
tara:strand:+ start:410 stop:1177 length:768 start_codon:yes stop_codon:yes gene_type:complete